MAFPENVPGSSRADDEVVKEVDIVLSTCTSGHLLLNQYPLRPPDIPDFRTPEQVKFKKKSQKLELCMQLNTNNSSYDKGRGELIQANILKNTKSKEIDNETLFRTQTLVSSIASGNNIDSYAVGIMLNGQLHLQPVSAVLQLRPNLTYLDTKKLDASGKSATSGGGYSSQEDSEAESGPKVETVRVKFARPETEAQKKRKESSFYHHEKVSEEEEWLKLKFASCFSVESIESKTAIVNEMYDKKTAGVSFVDQGQTVMHKLLSEDNLESVNSEPVTNKTLNTLEKRIESILKRVHIISFTKLSSMLNPGTDSSETILTILQSKAIILHGWWVVKSELLYADCKLPTVADAELLSRARDFVLQRFHNNGSIKRCELREAVSLTDQDCLFVLNGIARSSNEGGWKFPFERDSCFIENYPSYVSRQEILLQARWNKLQQIISAAKLVKNAAPLNKIRQRTRTRTVSARSIGSSDGELVVGEGPSQPRRRRKSSGHDKINGHINDNNNKEIENSGQGVVESQASKPLNRFLYEIFCSKRVLSLPDIHKFVRLKMAESAEDFGLSKDVSDDAIVSAAKKLDTTIFQPKAGPKIFIFGGSGAYPDFRQSLIKFLVQKQSFRLNSFKQACANIEMPSDDLIKKIIMEYCTCKRGVYSLMSS